MKITFKNKNAPITYEVNGDINISPQFINEFGYIDGTDMRPISFDFEGSSNGIHIKEG
ncbi:hypothetical protein LCGC14_2223510 [marine sediment metagenome]|uniref:Uncharacterized protein n=1 Tax=marine sediment metagenome TaxID=412755 RepID=A0A0F9DAC4_9ZZZZ